jgi:hypothetical protein
MISSNKRNASEKKTLIAHEWGHPVDVIYLTGVSYCGSTLMSFVVNSHPQILSIGEMGPAVAFEKEDYECSCGVELRRCPFVLAVKDVMERRYGVHFDIARWRLRHKYSDNRFFNSLMLGGLRSPLLRSMRDAVRPFIPSFRARMNDFARRNEAFIRASLDVSGKQVFFDATKVYPRIPFLQGIKGINLKVLHLVRDPRGYVYSAREKNESKSPQIASRDWVRENSSIERHLRNMPSNRWIRIKYEVFCTELKKTLELLMNFIGVESFSFSYNYYETTHHIIGNRMRLSSDPRKSIVLDENWKNALSLNDLKIISQIAGPLARKYGYNI